MSQQILQINFKFSVPREQYEGTAANLAEEFAKVPGCIWKVWLMNEKDREAGGIYLFADEASVEQPACGFGAGASCSKRFQHQAI